MTFAQSAFRFLAVGMSLSVCFCIASCSRNSPKDAAVQPATIGDNDKSTVAKEASNTRQPSNPSTDSAVSQKARTAAAISNAIAYLISQQADDGGWHSETHGAMKGGASITSLVLYAVSSLPSDERKQHDKQMKRALEFLRVGISKKGLVCCPDGTLDYPVYSTAMLLLAAPRLDLELSDMERNRLIEFLVSAQLTESLEFEPKQIDYGGWDLLGGSGTRGMTSGTNVSVSCFVLEALKQSKKESVGQAITRASKWLEGCQNFPADGGFYFHPKVDHFGNKAQWSDKANRQPRSYGTATCDGIRCLIACGNSKDSPRVKGALAWLEKHPELKDVPGFEKTSAQLGWKEGLWYYYCMTLARTLPLLPHDFAQEQRDRLEKAVLARQRDDGSWKNKSARMREDDPLIATCFALMALTSP